MINDDLNSEHDWEGVQGANDCLIVIDGNGQVVICNDICQRVLFGLKIDQQPMKFPFPSLNCSFLRYDQSPITLCEFKNHLGQNLDLLIKTKEGQVCQVTVSVTELELVGQVCYSIIMRQNSQRGRVDQEWYRRKSMSEALYTDLINDQLEVHYQPQINVEDNSLFGVEALVRWRHDKLGSVPPDIFVAIAEEFNFVDKLDFWVLRQTCYQLRLWRESAHYVPSISVNFSPTTFRNENLYGFLYSSLRENKLLPSDLVIEVTEGQKINEQDAIVEVLTCLNAMGVAISLDDFGAGYSNLKRLLKLPVSQLKLDRIFVKELSRSIAQELSEVVLNISKGLKVAIIAEGVEDKAQFDLLKKLGYNLFQGYFFSRPLPQLEFDQWLKKQAKLYS